MTTDAHGPHIHRSFAGRKIPDGPLRGLNFITAHLNDQNYKQRSLYFPPEMLNLYFIEEF